jgi:anti-sigma factor RsiW
MPCDLGDDLIHGYADGELDAARAAQVEQHLAGCEGCRAKLEEIEAMRTSLAVARLYTKAPSHVRYNVQAGLGMHRRWSRRALAATAAAVCAAAIAVLVLSPDGEEDTALLIDAHLRAMQPGHSMDVVSTDRHTVKPWFDG